MLNYFLIADLMNNEKKNWYRIYIANFLLGKGYISNNYKTHLGLI